MNKKRFKIIFMVLSIFIFILSIGFNIYGVIKLRDNVKTIENKNKIVKTIKKENAKLKKEIKTLEKDKQSNTNIISNNNNIIYKEKIIILDTFLDEMKNDIKNKTNNEGYKTYIETCEGQLPDNTITHQYEMNEAIIDKIISKLSQSTKVESEITASFFCPKYSLKTYKTKNDSIFSLYQANDNKILIVGYNDKGYAFTFNEDVSTFVKDLMNKKDK